MRLPADEAITLWAHFERGRRPRRARVLPLHEHREQRDHPRVGRHLRGDVLIGVGLPPGCSTAPRYHHLDADVAELDPVAGLVDLAAVTEALLASLRDRKVDVHEGSRRGRSWWREICCAC